MDSLWMDLEELPGLSVTPSVDREHEGGPFSNMVAPGSQSLVYQGFDDIPFDYTMDHDEEGFPSPGDSSPLSPGPLFLHQSPSLHHDSPLPLHASFPSTFGHRHTNMGLGAQTLENGILNLNLNRTFPDNYRDQLLPHQNPARCLKRDGLMLNSPRQKRIRVSSGIFMAEAFPYDTHSQQGINGSPSRPFRNDTDSKRYLSTSLPLFHRPQANNRVSMHKSLSRDFSFGESNDDSERPMVHDQADSDDPAPEVSEPPAQRKRKSSVRRKLKTNKPKARGRGKKQQEPRQYILKYQDLVPAIVKGPKGQTRGSSQGNWEDKLKQIKVVMAQVVSKRSGRGKRNSRQTKPEVFVLAKAVKAQTPAKRKSRAKKSGRKRNAKSSVAAERRPSELLPRDGKGISSAHASSELEFQLNH